MTETLQSRINEALEALDEHIKDYVDKDNLSKFLDNPDYDGTLSDIADWCVPVLDKDILDVMVSDHRILTRVPDLALAPNEKPTITRIASENIYELIEEALYEDVRRRELKHDLP